VPIIAGIVHMKKSKFMLYNVLSSLLWSFTLVFAGHYLYNLFLDQFNVDLKKHIETIILTLIAITTFPLVWNYFKQKKLLKNQE
jgi:membrane-associated protein